MTRIYTRMTNDSARNECKPASIKSAARRVTTWHDKQADIWQIQHPLRYDARGSYFICTLSFEKCPHFWNNSKEKLTNFNVRNLHAVEYYWKSHLLTLPKVCCNVRSTNFLRVMSTKSYLKPVNFTSIYWGKRGALWTHDIYTRKAFLHKICHPVADPAVHQHRLFQACFPIFSTGTRCHRQFRSTTLCLFLNSHLILMCSVMPLPDKERVYRG